MNSMFATTLILLGFLATSAAFTTSSSASFGRPAVASLMTSATKATGSLAFVPSSPASRLGNTKLYMSDMARDKKKKRKVTTIIKEETQVEQEEDEDEEKDWRVILHNDEIHTFQYVTRALVKTVGTLDRAAAFEVCVQTHGRGKGTVATTYKNEAMLFCLGLQRQGLTVSIAPDEDFEGGHGGGGNAGDSVK
mmetsp:Transcript_5640/g.7877  ORF Transcript_5640/g.7877 Transcript_5640/m.7877 type:complete len:193 (-) Transcript_5640:87-665(-)|eukprot:CAMPEP_0194032668 /NCGR_PEP_ID=MMETSP0009_2-20130614/5558_1 /TAXON_ID=210454 /ORGANISM="Grammatophora oceanica, Strain CCMP 410" /LENGTH=192 /DNA_ID=CAMNT_0038673177 /DNA_START=133 /DNA_END=711 /DNA_ORIENTATION=+